MGVVYAVYLHMGISVCYVAHIWGFVCVVSICTGVDMHCMTTVCMLCACMSVEGSMCMFTSTCSLCKGSMHMDTSVRAKFVLQSSVCCIYM